MNEFQEMPLNKAHLNERKAQKCLESGDWDGALKYYQLARDFISKAMETTSCVKSLQCLQLQYDYFLNHCGRQVELNRIEQEVIGTALNQNIAKEEFIEVQLNSQTLTDLKEKSKPDHNFSHEFTEREPDSLLQFLNGSPKEAVYNKHRKKYPKADVDRIEELKVQNEQLKRIVLDIQKDKERLEKENRSLRDDNEALLFEVKELNNKLDASQLMPEAVESNEVPHFVVEDYRYVEPSSILQEPCYFDFNEPLIQHQIRNAMLEDPKPVLKDVKNGDASCTIEAKDVSNRKDVTDASSHMNRKRTSTNLTSVRYEEMEESSINVATRSVQ
ncbi:unnamed protein product [Clavelina lepadiformis]|uniref:Nuclear receptor-binding factor 2 n=1 Tax=Clavelina lepadiformis TaxID=159417 RepID=A0ABP0H004_CLALP